MTSMTTTETLATAAWAKFETARADAWTTRTAIDHGYIALLRARAIWISDLVEMAGSTLRGETEIAAARAELATL